MIAAGIHLKTRLNASVQKTVADRLPRLNGAGSGSEPFAGLRDALAGVFCGESLRLSPRIRKILDKGIGKVVVVPWRFLKNRGWQGIFTVSFATLSFSHRTERSTSI